MIQHYINANKVLSRAGSHSKPYYEAWAYDKAVEVGLIQIHKTLTLHRGATNYAKLHQQHKDATGKPITADTRDIVSDMDCYVPLGSVTCSDNPDHGLRTALLRLFPRAPADAKPTDAIESLRHLQLELKGAEATTLPAILDYAANKLGDAPCLGTRQILARERFVEDGKEREKMRLGEYTFLTYREVQDVVVKFASGLGHIGTGDSGRVAMFSETRAEWLMAALGCLRHRQAVVTVYTTLPDDNIVSSLNETEVRVVITSQQLLARTMALLPQCPAVKHVIVFEDQLEGIGTVAEDLGGVAVTPFQDVVDVHRDDRYLAYLPLAHVMELAAEMALLANNVVIMYGSPLTLTNNSPKVMSGTLGDTIVKGVNNVAQDQGFLKRKIFSKALEIKKKQSAPEFVNKILDFVVFNKVKEQLGGQVRLIVVGGAPLSADTHANIRALFGCNVLVGYGATETTACISAAVPSDQRTGHCGAPCYGVQLTLMDWEDGGYRTTDKPHPRGEILVAGPTVAKGYFRLPMVTQEAFVEHHGQRWYMTGDIGQIDDTGVLRIIDRKKDLVKLRDGEFLSLGDIETKLKTHPRCICVSVPSEDRLRKLTERLNLDSKRDFESLTQDPAVVAAVLKELQVYGMQQGLRQRDLPVGLFLNTKPWTPETGLVTAAFKIRRQALVDYFKEHISALYSKYEDPQ
ncbi:long-chain-fatty-acid--CoA ligase 4-like [Penaeus chinensis]|uniref:long-chain-fatty-acid--CoA ligase 4-like n=1 Tax=Penaeus chinensis TaxID=139456 RepID=UPI001FB7A9A7|nr:long-chain-fatty-acid--CoA ligase 4-like [Penaeus chinensis]